MNYPEFGAGPPYMGGLAEKHSGFISPAALHRMVDPRLLGKPVMFLEGGGVMVMINGGWQMLNENYSVTIDLAPPSPLAMAGTAGMCPTTPDVLR